MSTLDIQKKIAPLIPKGSNLEGFLKEAIILQFQETNKKIAVFEAKYNGSFEDFKRKWKKTKNSKKFSYELEGDFFDWEALDQYKRDLLRVIHSL